MKSGIPFGIVKAGVAPKPGCRVQIASVQTLKNRPIEALSKANKRALVFVDEGHRVKANTYLQILRDLRTTYEVVYVVYLTAHLTGSMGGDSGMWRTRSWKPPTKGTHFAGLHHRRHSHRASATGTA